MATQLTWTACRRQSELHQRQAAAQSAQISTERRQVACAREAAQAAQAQCQQVAALSLCAGSLAASALLSCRPGDSLSAACSSSRSLLR